MNVVILDGDISYPPTSGKRLRTLNLMTRLADHHRITYIARGDAHARDAHRAVEYFRDHHIEPILVHHPVAQKTGLRFYARLFGNLFSSQPYSVTSHFSRPMREAVCDHAARNNVDLWQLEWVPYSANMDLQHPAPKLAMAHNVDTLIWRRYFETAAHPAKRWFLKRQWRKFARYERCAFAKMDRIVAVSEEDAALLRNEFDIHNVDVVDNGMDYAYFTEATGARKANTILFLGALDWRPNTDAVEVLLTQIFPKVREHVPEAQLWIVGRNPSRALVERVRRVEGVTLHADVPDVRPYLAGASVMAVPLRIGGGSRLKILEALACATPVVSTRIGAEGLRVLSGRHYDQAEVNDMAMTLTRVLENPTRAQSMAEQGRDLVSREYDWSVLADKLELVWDSTHTPARELAVQTS